MMGFFGLELVISLFSPKTTKTWQHPCIIDTKADRSVAAIGPGYRRAWQTHGKTRL